MRCLQCVVPLTVLSGVLAHHEMHAGGYGGHEQQPLSHDHDQTEWVQKYGAQIDQTFSGPLSFSHLPYHKCLEDTAVDFDIAVLGMPFDTGVSYRPGARFGPFGIRAGSRRQRETRGYTLAWGMNPYAQGSNVIDCGDVPVNAFDNALAVDQMEVAYNTLLARPVASNRPSGLAKFAKDHREHPRIVTMGGDHTIVLPILRSLNKVYGPVSVIHFDAHLDTWGPYPGPNSDQSRITHGTFFHVAGEEGLMTSTNIHAGIRCKLGGVEDIENDRKFGFELITTEDIDDLGVTAFIKRVRERIGDSPVYLSLDIDVIDPGLAPATGTPEAGGWTTRELKRILRGLAGLNFVGADIVEVAPVYDHAEITSIVAADLIHDLLSMFLAEGTVKTRPLPLKDEL
ncbi:arginase deacetylase [Cristinia sonorae]|uniref:Arginase deacetylase n=1 Tax=Cristinia sonorae TaxID=1940300 RepID=A0A8K0UN98_9AGAR|nr:arginase deacetylase [Cristinia sonorae]